MAGQRVGYVRVSTLDQNEKRQLDGLVLDRVFTDRASGRDTARPQLTELLGFARDGDTVVVHSMDRLARNLDDLRALVQALTRKGVRVEFVKEHLLFTGEDSPMANLMLSVMGAFAEFERTLIKERQREGIALAQQRGAYRGRKKTLTPERAAEMIQRSVAGVSKSVLAHDYGISRETVYQYLRQATLSSAVLPSGHSEQPEFRSAGGVSVPASPHRFRYPAAEPGARRSFSHSPVARCSLRRLRRRGQMLR